MKELRVIKAYRDQGKHTDRQPLDHHAAERQSPDRFADADATASSILA